MDKLIKDFKSINYFWIFMVLVAFTVSNISRAIRWQMLIRPMGYRPRFINAFLTIIINYLANLGLPRIGEVIRAAMMSRYEKIPVEKLVGTIVIGRTMDLVCLASVIGLTFLLEFDEMYTYLKPAEEGNSGGGGLLTNPWVIGFLLTGVIGAFMLFLLRKQLMQTKLYDKIVGFVKGLWEGMKSVRDLESPGLFVFHSVVIWVMYYFMTYLCFFAFGVTEHLPAIAGLTVFTFGALGILIPSPGGMGSYQWLTVQALAIYGIDGPDAFSFANILFFSIQLGCNFILGFAALIALPIINKNYKPQPLTDQT